MSLYDNDAVSLLISRGISPKTLAALLRVERNTVALWALALAEVPPDLVPLIDRMQRSTAAGDRPDFDALAWDLAALDAGDWRRVMEERFAPADATAAGALAFASPRACAPASGRAA